MKPLEIEILLHYNCHANDYRGGDFSAPAVREAINKFRDQGFLAPSNCFGAAYEPTTKSCAFISALCAVPEPEQTWVVRWPQDGEGVA